MKSVKNVFKKIVGANEFGVALSLIVLYAVIAVVNADFFKLVNIVDVLRTTGYYFVVAAPLTLVIMSGDMDLSIGAMTNFGGVLCVALMLAGVPLVPAIILTLVVSAGIGYIKAIFVVKSKLMAMITTLGLQYVINGAILVYTEGMPIVINNPALKVIGQGKAGGILFYSIIFSLVVGVFFHILLKHSKFGRKVSAVGGNQETARLAGINVTKIRFTTNITVSVFAAVVGIIYASRFNSAQPAIASGTELTIMASVIIGGVGLGGGFGSIIGTFLGSLLIASIKSGLVLMHVSSYWQNLVFGAILIASLYVDKYRREKLGASL